MAFAERAGSPTSPRSLGFLARRTRSIPALPGVSDHCCGRSGPAGGRRRNGAPYLGVAGAHRVRDTVVFLLPAERKLVELIYFDDMTCSDAGRLLGWSSSKSHRPQSPAALTKPTHWWPWRC